MSIAAKVANSENISAEKKCDLPHIHLHPALGAEIADFGDQKSLKKVLKEKNEKIKILFSLTLI